jgi:hypothetical protein
MDGNTLAVKGLGAHPAAPIVEEAQVVVHEADQPDVIGDLACERALLQHSVTRRAISTMF